MASNVAGFTPSKTVAIAITATAATATLTTGAGNQLFIQNDGASTVYFVVGTAAIAATAGSSASMPLLANTSLFVAVDANTTTSLTISAVASATSAAQNLRITQGYGSQ